MRIGKSRGSFLPVLIKLISETTGPIIELGVGFCSTPFLHWACYHNKRRLVSYENNPEYYNFAMSWKDDFHSVNCITDWDLVSLSEPWDVAFVDHSPGSRRGIEVARLLHANYVIVHDSENVHMAKQGLDRVFKLFKYRYKYDAAYPATSIWSNKHDVRNFEV
jgi:predicted O-methyltransferase YrrM